MYCNRFIGETLVHT